jgi:peptidyl-tRNA hydrolase, PTH1 family
MWLVVGLGNPGPGYARDRHNVGARALGVLAERLRADPPKEKFSGLLRRGEVDGETVLLLEPTTFMNRSGASVQPAAAFYKVDPSRILVIHDELDLPFGEVRLKSGGGHAGHNGLRSIVERLGTPDFARVRVGIGRPPPEWVRQGEGGEVSSFVLAPFTASEEEQLPGVLKKASESVLEVALRGLQPAMKVTNTRGRPHRA